jgi:hypothetical protein
MLRYHSKTLSHEADTLYIIKGKLASSVTGKDKESGVYIEVTYIYVAHLAGVYIIYINYIIFFKDSYRQL